MTFRDILAPVISLEDDEPALASASEIAARFDAKVAALIVAIHTASDFAETDAPLSAVLADIARGTQSRVATLRRELVDWLAGAGAQFEVRDVTIEEAVNEDRVAAHARVADLVVISRGAAHNRARQEMIEDVLFRSGRPLLLVPGKPQRRRDWKTIVIGWNAKAEAVRAVTGSLPLLKAADRVVIATVDATPSPAGHSEAPGHDIAAHLARHGVNVEVSNIDGLGRTAGRALLDEAIAHDADVIVLGAYGHSRARELIFGGVTRELMASATVPLLMAH
jgi:nucleotide-binding universal stress UspA family protein